MAKFKQLNGVNILCGHVKNIMDDGDAECVQCSDGYGDICMSCLEKSHDCVIIYYCDENCIDEDRNINGATYDEDGDMEFPFPNNKEVSNTVFLGTLEECAKYMKTI